MRNGTICVQRKQGQPLRKKEKFSKSRINIKVILVISFTVAAYAFGFMLFLSIAGCRIKPHKYIFGPAADAFAGWWYKQHDKYCIQ